MLEGYRKKLAYVYATRNGRVAMAVGALAIVLISVFPVMLPVFLIVMIILTIRSRILLPRSDLPAAQQEVLKRIPEPLLDNQVARGFLHWLPVPALMALSAAAVIITGDLRTFIVADPPGPFFDYLHWLCEASVTEETTDGACDAAGFSPVLAAHFLMTGWISMSSIVYLYLNRGIFLSGLRFYWSDTVNILFLGLLTLLICIFGPFMHWLLFYDGYESTHLAMLGTIIKEPPYSSLYVYKTYIEAVFYQMAVMNGFYIVYLYFMSTLCFLGYGVAIPTRLKPGDTDAGSPADRE